MSIQVYIPLNLRRFTNNTEVMEVNGSTVGDCLNHLVKQFPGIKKMLLLVTVNCMIMLLFILIERMLARRNYLNRLRIKMSFLYLYYIQFLVNKVACSSE